MGRLGMILGAGLGTRLLPLTRERPKPLIEVLGEPLIHHALEHMLRANVSEVVINTHHLGEQLAQTLGVSYKGMPLRYLHEDPILNTGGALKNAQPYLTRTGYDILLMNGDILIDLDIESLFNTHRREKNLATLVLKSVDNPSAFGVVGSDADGRIRTLLDLVPYEGSALLERMFCGVHVLSQQALEHFPKEMAFSIIDRFYAPLLRQGEQIGSFEQSGYYCDAGTPERIAAANFDLLSGKVRLKHSDPFGRFVPSEGRRYVGERVNIAKDVKIHEPVLIDEGAVIEGGAEVGPCAVIGKRAKVSRHAKIRHAVLLADAVLDAGESCDHEIVASQARISWQALG